MTWHRNDRVYVVSEPDITGTVLYTRSTNGSDLVYIALDSESGWLTCGQGIDWFYADQLEWFTEPSWEPFPTVQDTVDALLRVKDYLENRRGLYDWYNGGLAVVRRVLNDLHREVDHVA